MRRYIFGERDGIYIIDLLQTVELLERAGVHGGSRLARRRGPVRRHQEAGEGHDQRGRRGGRHALRERALARRPAHQLPHDPQAHRPPARAARLSEEGRLDLLPTKERMSMEAELHKLETNLSGVAEMDRLPDALFVTDLKVEEIAVREAARLEPLHDRARGHQLRPRAGRLRGSGQRRRDPVQRRRDQADRQRGRRGRARWLRKEQARREAGGGRAPRSRGTCSAGRPRTGQARGRGAGEARGGGGRGRAGPGGRRRAPRPESGAAEGAAEAAASGARADHQPRSGAAADRAPPPRRTREGSTDASPPATSRRSGTARARA